MILSKCTASCLPSLLITYIVDIVHSPQAPLPSTKWTLQYDLYALYSIRRWRSQRKFLLQSETVLLLVSIQSRTTRTSYHSALEIHTPRLAHLSPVLQFGPTLQQRVRQWGLYPHEDESSRTHFGPCREITITSEFYFGCYLSKSSANLKFPPAPENEIDPHSPRLLLLRMRCGVHSSGSGRELNQSKKVAVLGFCNFRLLWRGREANANWKSGSEHFLFFGFLNTRAGGRRPRELQGGTGRSMGLIGRWTNTKRWLHQQSIGNKCGSFDHDHNDWATSLGLYFIR